MCLFIPIMPLHIIGLAWLIMRVLDLMIEFIRPLYNLLQHFLDWTLSASGHTTLDYSSRSHSLLYSLGADSTGNTSIAKQWTSINVAYYCRLYLATGCLPRIGLRGKVFIEPLPSNGPNVTICWKWIQQLSNDDITIHVTIWRWSRPQRCWHCIEFM
jgi:hypothetical protein